MIAKNSKQALLFRTTYGTHLSHNATIQAAPAQARPFHLFVDNSAGLPPRTEFAAAISLLPVITGHFLKHIQYFISRRNTVMQVKRPAVVIPASQRPPVIDPASTIGVQMGTGRHMLTIFQQ